MSRWKRTDTEILEDPCDICNQRITEAGALAFGPPDELGRVEMFRICVICWEPWSAILNSVIIPHSMPSESTRTLTSPHVIDAITDFINDPEPRPEPKVAKVCPDCGFKSWNPNILRCTLATPEGKACGARMLPIHLYDPDR